MSASARHHTCRRTSPSRNGGFSSSSPPARSNAQIADRLCIAPSTVRKHLEHIFPKLGVTNRLAAAMAFEGRELPDPDREAVVRRYA